MTDRKKPGVAFWAGAVVIAGLVLYAMSIGPAAWLVNREILPLRATAVFYKPVVKLIFNSPDWLFTVATLDDPHVGVTIWKMRYVLDPLRPESEPVLLSY